MFDRRVGGTVAARFRGGAGGAGGGGAVDSALKDVISVRTQQDLLYGKMIATFYNLCDACNSCIKKLARG